MLSDGLGDMLSEDSLDHAEVEAGDGQSTLITVNRALRLLRIVVFEQGLSVREAAREIGTSPSSAARLLRTLEHAGFIQRGGDGGRFQLGSELRRMVAHILGTSDVRRAALGPMRTLVDRWQETVTLCLRVGDTRLNFDRVPSPRTVQCILPLGQTMPLHVGSSGRAILAHMGPAEVDRLLSQDLKAYTQKTPTDPSVIRADLVRVRERGYAISHGEGLDLEQVGVSAPIFDGTGTVIGSLLVSIPSSRVAWTDGLIEMGHSVREATDEISLQLGWIANGE